MRRCVRNKSPAAEFCSARALLPLTSEITEVSSASRKPISGGFFGDRRKTANPWPIHQFRHRNNVFLRLFSSCVLKYHPGSFWFSSVATSTRRFQISHSIQSPRYSLLFPASWRVKSNETNMRIVGLTGGIASGKSTVSDLFRSSGVPVVDADIVARDVVKKGTPGWRKVAAAFGDDVLLENGEINRSRLGQIVFSDPAKRQLLNRLLAPHISSGIFWEIIKLWVKGCPVIILDIPLLFEAKMDRRTKPIIVVWVNPETQLQRLMARDGISEEEARNKINAQDSLDRKKTKADIVIDNSGSMEDTRSQFQMVLKQVTAALSWKEFAFSRESVAMVLVSLFIGSWMLYRRM